MVDHFLDVVVVVVVVQKLIRFKSLGLVSPKLRSGEARSLG